MRETKTAQASLVFEYVDHQHVEELEAMGKQLDALPSSGWEVVHRDLVGESSRTRGRKGMSAEQVVRVMVVMQLTKVSCEKLSYLLLDSRGYDGSAAYPRASDSRRRPCRAIFRDCGLSHWSCSTAP